MPMDDKQIGALMAAELAGLLDAVPASRRVFPHLGVLEQTLGNHGLEGIEGMPQPVLEKALSQLRTLPLEPRHALLHKLLSLLDMAVEARQLRAAVSRDASFAETEAVEDSGLSVSEATHTDFARALDLFEQRGR